MASVTSAVEARALLRTAAVDGLDAKYLAKPALHESARFDKVAAPLETLLKHLLGAEAAGSEDELTQSMARAVKEYAVTSGALECLLMQVGELLSAYVPPGGTASSVDSGTDEVDRDCAAALAAVVKARADKAARSAAAAEAAAKAKAESKTDDVAKPQRGIVFAKGTGYGADGYASGSDLDDDGYGGYGSGNGGVATTTVVSEGCVNAAKSVDRQVTRVLRVVEAIARHAPTTDSDSDSADDSAAKWYSHLTACLARSPLPALFRNLSHGTSEDFASRSALYIAFFDVLDAIVGTAELHEVLTAKASVDADGTPEADSDMVHSARVLAATARAYSEITVAPDAAAAGAGASTETSGASDTKVDGAAAPAEAGKDSAVEDDEDALAAAEAAVMARAAALVDAIEAAASTSASGDDAASTAASTATATSTSTSTATTTHTDADASPAKAAPAESYEDLMRPLQLRASYGVAGRLDSSWLTADASSGQDGKKRLRRVMRELRGLKSSLPLNEASTVWLRYDAAKPYAMQVMVSGPWDTPYDSGLFVFDVMAKTDYPDHAPHCVVSSRSTKAKSVGWGPNLYADGKVCLSLLGTWGGSSIESWTKDSTLLQLMISVQSLVLGTEEPYYQEPGNESYRNDEQSRMSAAAAGGWEALRVQTLREAITDMMRSPPEGFEDVARMHFKLMKAHIDATVDKWLAHADAIAEATNQHRHALHSAVEAYRETMEKLLDGTIDEFNFAAADAKRAEVLAAAIAASPGAAAVESASAPVAPVTPQVVSPTPASSAAAPLTFAALSAPAPPPPPSSAPAPPPSLPLAPATSTSSIVSAPTSPVAAGAGDAPSIAPLVTSEFVGAEEPKPKPDAPPGGWTTKNAAAWARNLLLATGKRPPELDVEDNPAVEAAAGAPSPPPMATSMSRSESV